MIHALLALLTVAAYIDWLSAEADAVEGAR
jgi:hypothetical protein